MDQFLKQQVKEEDKKINKLKIKKLDKKKQIALQTMD